MGLGRSSREDREYRRFRYEISDVLINKLDIRDAARLEEVERALVRERLDDPLPAAARQLTPAGLKAIHRHLFQDVYDWAGAIRTYTTGRGAAPFAVPEFIDRSLDDQFAELGRLKLLRGSSPGDFARHAAALINELNAIHPFIEGNGRTQRVWLRQLGAQAGYRISLQSRDRAPWYEASRIGFEKQDHRPMEALIAARLESPSARVDRSDDIDR